MNREERRAAERRARRQDGVRLVHTLAEQPGCPDCAADVALTEEAPGVFVLTVSHDDTCPMYRRRRVCP